MKKTAFGLLAALVAVALTACQSITAEKTIGTKPISVISGAVDGRTLDASMVKDGQTLVYNKRARSLAPDRTVDDQTKTSIMGNIDAGNIGAAIKALEAVKNASSGSASDFINKNRDLDEQFIVTPDAASAVAITTAFYADSMTGAKIDLSLHGDYQVGAPTAAKPPVPPVVVTPPATNGTDTGTKPTPASNSAPVAADALDVSNAITLGTHADVHPNEAAITRVLKSAVIEGSNVRLEFDKPLGWSTKTSNGKTIDGRVYIFWREGDQIVGGHFDWHGLDQEVKTMNNIPAGYLSGQKPPSGAPVWFCLINREGDQRTNVVLCDNTYP